MTVYIVTSGQYSDYEIEAVFLDKEVADRYVKAHYTGGIREKNGYGYRVEPWETMGPTEEKEA